MKQFKNILLMVVLCLPQLSHAWGLRGHGLICEAAAHLVKDPGLQDFLRFRIPTLAYGCNLPDIHWRSLPAEFTQMGNPTHYINPEVVGHTLATLPLDWAKLEAEYTGTEDRANPGKKILDFHRSLGSIWWRADDLAKIAIEEWSKAQSSPSPQNRGEEQSDALPFNQHVFAGFVALITMGHFIGDASMPFHSTVDFDGYDRGHGGVHNFYEEESLAWLDANALTQILAAAKPFLKKERGTKSTFLERIKRLTVISNKDRDKVLQLDPVTKKSEVKNDKGMTLKTPAERRAFKPSQLKKWQQLQIEHLARAAAVLAIYWDEIYEQSKRPQLQDYKSYRYPHAAEFIKPRYLSTRPK